MKISISYPPLESEKGIPLLSQNRQFQWFKEPTYIYPIVPAYTASLLKTGGHDVIWDDGIAERLQYGKWLERILSQHPDIIMLESKTPVIKRHWKIIDEIKGANPEIKIALVGDHVTAMPEESMKMSRVDYVLQGGDYDFGMLNLVNWLDKKEKLKKGWWTRDKNRIISSEFQDLKSHKLDDLPSIDRELTKWELYAYHNGNYKYTPGTYVMAGRDCWWGKCSFCSWTTSYPGKNFRTRSPMSQVNEIEMLVHKYKVKEIFDDSGCFPKGAWLKEFCSLVIARGLHKKVVLGCNMRVGALSQDEWNLMKKANFRFILIGLESINQDTLDRLVKGIKVQQIEETVKMAKKAGLEPHITTMVGYPWESKKDAENTIEFAKNLFKKGYLDTLQATIVVPYPGTPMFYEARKKGWLITEDWDRYDMKESVWNSPVSNDDVLELTKGLYTSALSPKFLFRKVSSIRNLDDIKYLFRAGRKFMGHLADFKKKN